MSRHQTVFDALDLFTRAIEQGKPRIYAIIITERGKSNEHPLGLVTPWDLLSV